MEPNNETKNGNLVGLALLGIIAVVVVVGFVLSQGKGSNTNNTLDNKMTTEDKDTVEEASPAVDLDKDTLGENDESSPSATVKEFTIKASNFKFDIAEIKVKVGDKVRVVLENSGGFHDWQIDEFNVGTKVLNSGEKETVEFIANKAGTFEYYCSVGQHRQMGMKGNLVVEQ